MPIIIFFPNVLLSIFWIYPVIEFFTLKISKWSSYRARLFHLGGKQIQSLYRSIYNHKILFLFTSVAQIRYLLIGPTQYFPPCDGTGLLHCLMEKETPDPQVREQSLQSDQLPQFPSTVPGRWPTMRHFPLKHH